METTYYITKANFLRLINAIADNYTAPDDTYYTYEIEQLTSDEINLVLWVKYFLSNTREVSECLKGIVECEYHNYLIPSSKPACHSHDGCILMRNSYLNFDLPGGIKGIAERVERCRQIYYELLDEIKEDTFPVQYELKKAKSKLAAAIKNDNQFCKWDGTLGLSLKTLNADSFPEIKKSNSGVVELQFVETEIDNLFEQFKKGFEQESRTKGRKTETVQMRARHYFRNHNYNSKIIELLIDFHIWKLNPTLSFEREILNSLGFKACQSCRDYENEVEEFDLPVSDAARDYSNRILSVYDIVTDYGTERFSNRPDMALLSWDDFKKQPIGTISYCLHQVHKTYQAVIKTDNDKYVFATLPKDRKGDDIFLSEVKVVSAKRKDINNSIRSKNELHLLLLPSEYPSDL